MRLTKAVEYALRSAIYLAWNRRRAASLGEIARVQNIPPSSLSQALRWLCGKGIIQSRAGHKGGYQMLKDPSEVNLRQVIEAVEGPIFHNNCLIHGAPCASASDHWCPVHEVWENASKEFLSALERYSLGELAARVARWNTVDEMLKNLLTASGRGK